MYRAELFALPGPGPGARGPGADTPLLKNRSGAAPKSDLLLRAIYFKGGVPNPFLALKWSDLGPPTSGQVRWG